MYTAIEMIPTEGTWLERNLRLGGFQSRDAAEKAVLRKGCGFVKQYGGEIVSVVIKGKIWIVEQETLHGRVVKGSR